ncbi:heavy metal translocating P-type ATPase [Clostridium sp. AF36-4]|uniref:heavy metal translocating P-type ATPase n=1 Tax=Clostridium sp. AF36-4 TaxID=2293015 RepID=UPI000E3F2243|nr:heavy metal translocating P-type ATPase [Clostridium sp. AF36-4]RGF57317.1 heavy metal translocating P-type ATPase [Clostridium sp. AF36-4]
MKFKVLHNMRGRMRIHVMTNEMTDLQADKLEYDLAAQDMILAAKVYERTSDVVITYAGERQLLLSYLQTYYYRRKVEEDETLARSGRAMNRKYWDKLVNRVVLRMGSKLFVPAPIRTGLVLVKSLSYIKKALSCVGRRKIEVPLLDGIAITTSIVRGDYGTAGSVMFLLDLGEIMEEWTRKKSVDDLAKKMSLNVSKVWLNVDGKEVLTDVSKIETGDCVTVHMGNVIPLDGVIKEGEGMVNQASLTGEAIPVAKKPGGYVYAGTVLEEGELLIEVKENSGTTKYEKIVAMIEETEKLKSTVESRAEHLADRLVPYTLAGTGLVYLLTRNVTKALSVLMVDFSCALKLSMPISVLSAMREAQSHGITVKGGKFLEAIAEADTIVFDKTGTITKAQPVVSDVISFCDEEPDELLRIAACLEEHFPHSMAKAVVRAAMDKGLVHEENHSKVEYIVAHGISSRIQDKKVIIGSYHFVFEDEQCVIPQGKEELFESLSGECSHLYLAIDGVLAAVIAITDPIREEAPRVVSMLRKCGLSKIVMMTGDSERTAKVVAAKVGVDEYYSEVLPEDKASYVEKEHQAGRKVIMIGDGVNDSPALSAADVGIAICDGAEMAREIADITIAGDNLEELVTLKRLSNALVKRIHGNYRQIVGFNTGLILCGIGGVMQPATSALLHNTSTLAISVKSMKDLLNEKDEK